MGGKTKHGDSRTRLYKEWQSMRYRCQNKNHTSFHKYGGKGIHVCALWDKDYLSFKEWSLKNGYTDSLTIDRIDGEKGYCPENCRWVGYDIQNTNLGRLKNNTRGYRGVSWNKERGMWRCNISIKNRTVWIGDYSSVEDAIKARNCFIRDNELPHQETIFIP